jgi:hypothetical protein
MNKTILIGQTEEVGLSGLDLSFLKKHGVYSCNPYQTAEFIDQNTLVLIAKQQTVRLFCRMV